VVKITFKNVGQGDSIIIEWSSNGTPKTGIIDCNLYQGTNPVLKHLIKNNTTEIEFLILSHPHLDHFSGFIDLLEYCRSNKIIINRFLHTSESTPDYLKTASRSKAAAKELSKLFMLLKEMRNNNELEVHSINDNPFLIIPLGNEFKMRVLAPSAIEIDKYIKGVKYPFDEEESTSNPNANWLATVLKIYNDFGSIILTSDVETSVLSRIGNKKKGRIGNDKILIGQAPHHGSKGNLNKVFWSLRKRHLVTPIVISVGKNTYNHPSNEVIGLFNRLPNYEVIRTDDSKTKFKISDKSLNISNILDIISDEKPTSIDKISNGDKTFVVTNSTFKMEGN
jgi:competence protein ComEC